MKKHLSVVIVLLIILALTSCGHQHTMAEKTVKEKTCTEDGEIQHYCTTCDYKYSETVKASHNYDEEIITPSTCQTKGKSKFTCKDCGDNYEKELALASHNYENKYCTVCGIKKIGKITTPIYLGEYKYGAAGTVRTTCKITSVNAEINSYGIMTVYFDGEKTYDLAGDNMNGPVSFMLIIKDAFGNVVYSDQVMTYCIVDQEFKVKITPKIRFDESEDYRIELDDYMM